VLEEARVVVNTPVVVLIPRSRQGEAGLQVYNGRLVRFGVNLDVGLSSTGLEVEGRQVWRLCSGGINLGKLLRRYTAVLGTTDPDVVRELDTGAEEVVPGVDAQDSTKTVLKVVLVCMSEGVFSTGGHRTLLAASRFTRSISNHVRQNTRESHMQ
jgi:hypothetical protein